MFEDFADELLMTYEEMEYVTFPYIPIKSTSKIKNLMI